MTGFNESYLGKLRSILGHELLLSPGVQILLIRDDQRILVQRRADNGMWELPAGSCEPGQSFRTAAVAELFEETNIRIQPADLIPFASLSDPSIHTLTYPNGDQVHAFALCFWASAPGDDAAINDGEAVEHRWVDPSDLPHPIHPPTAAVIRLFNRYQASGHTFQAE
jgi:8-oxo-dGTP pyrophosphatase MutT (NUDIX family)